MYVFVLVSITSKLFAIHCYTHQKATTVNVKHFNTGVNINKRIPFLFRLDTQPSVIGESVYKYLHTN